MRCVFRWHVLSLGNQPFRLIICLLLASIFAVVRITFSMNAFFECRREFGTIVTTTLTLRDGSATLAFEAYSSCTTDNSRPTVCMVSSFSELGECGN
jgi:hypothetical protein